MQANGVVTVKEQDIRKQMEQADIKIKVREKQLKDLKQEQEKLISKLPEQNNLVKREDGSVEFWYGGDDYYKNSPFNPNRTTLIQTYQNTGTNRVQVP